MAGGIRGFLYGIAPVVVIDDASTVSWDELEIVVVETVNEIMDRAEGKV